MNFEQIRQVTKKDDRGYFLKLDMFGTLNSFEPVKFTESGSRYQQVMITDGNGERNKVKIWLGDEKTIGDGCINKRLAFQISKNPYKNQMYYSGFWDDQKTVAPARTPAKAPQSPQEGQTAPTPTQTPKKEPDWDAKDLRMAKECALKCAVQKQVIMADIAKDITRVDSAEIIKWAEFFVDWIYSNGETPLELEKEAGDLLKGKSFEEQYNLNENPPDET
jgi:hypothetical protein